MITNTPAPKEEPFTFVRPQVPARPFADGAELEANRDSLLPAAQAFTYADEALQRATAEAERIGQDPNRTPQGKRVAFAEFAKPELAKLRTHLAALEKAEAVIKAEAEQIVKVAKPPAASDGVRAERSAIAQAFGQASPAVKKAALERAMLGKDPALASALAYAHPMLSGLHENTIELLRADIEGSGIDQAAAEVVRDKAFKLGTVRKTVTSAIEAIESAADHAELKAAEVATLRKSDFASAKDKSDYIDAHGLESWKRLPA